MGDFFLGVDLGQARDYTALVVVERVAVEPTTEHPPPEPFKRRSCFLPGYGPPPAEAKTRTRREYHVRHVERLGLGISYPAAVDRVRRLLVDVGRGAELVVDATGVGRAVVDLFEAAGVYPVSVTITSGEASSENGSWWRVPKRDLVSSVEVLLHDGQLKIASALAERATLVTEMLAFRANVSATGRDTYGAVGAGTHDDLVIALALACWRARTTDRAPNGTPVAGISEPFVNDDVREESWLGDPRHRFLVGCTGRGSRFVGGGARGTRSGPPGHRRW